MNRELLSAAERAYQEALDLLYSTINFEEKIIDRYQAHKIDTSRTRRLLQLLDDPHEQFPSIHIAGTKGKGSVAVMCAAVLRASGLRVGLYTSPHLRDFRERIRVQTPEDEKGWIPKADFVVLMNQVHDHFKAVPDLTWFEIVTAVAFRYFADQQVDAAVVEVGLGGRLDTTNVLTPLVSVITSLSLDHTALLGDTLTQIAAEKGGIIKSGVPVVSAPQADEAMVVLKDLARKQNAPLTIIGQDWRYQGSNRRLLITGSPYGALVPPPSSFDLALAGYHQLENAVVALATLDTVKQYFPTITTAAICEGLANVKWDGRLQLIYESPDHPSLLVDSAHNKDSAQKLAAALAAEYEYQNLWFIFGAPQDKDIAQMMNLLFPMAKGIIVAAADHPRAASPVYLAEQALAQGFTVIPASSVGRALEQSFELAAAGDLICACGSIIFIGDLLNQWDNLKSQVTVN